MECKKCGCSMGYCGTDNVFDDKGNKIEQIDYYNCPLCGHDDVKYFGLENKK